LSFIKLNRAEQKQLQDSELEDKRILVNKQQRTGLARFKALRLANCCFFAFEPLLSPSTLAAWFAKFAALSCREVVTDLKYCMVMVELQQMKR